MVERLTPAARVSFKRVRTRGEAAYHGARLEITCANAECGRRRVVAPFQLLGRFAASATFAQIGARLVCRGADLEGGGCGHRGAIVRFILDDGPPDPTSPAPSGGNVVLFVDRRNAAGDVVMRPTRRVARGRRRAEKRSHLR